MAIGRSIGRQALLIALLGGSHLGAAFSVALASWSAGWRPLVHRRHAQDQAHFPVVRRGGGRVVTTAMVAGAAGQEGYRVNKVLCEKYSRRETDRLVAEGRVMINGAAATPGDRVHPTDRIEVDGRKVPFPHDRLSGGTVANGAASGGRGGGKGAGGATRGAKLVYIIYNKPAGVVCTTDHNIRYNIKLFATNLS